MDAPGGPFADVAVFLRQVEADLAGRAAQAPLPPAAKLRVLLERTKDVETVLAGNLRDALLDLCEAVEWSYATPEVRGCAPLPASG